MTAVEMTMASPGMDRGVVGELSGPRWNCEKSEHSCRVDEFVDLQVQRLQRLETKQPFSKEGGRELCLEEGRKELRSKEGWREPLPR